jgi:broad specificity phosphatase PhoE
MPSILLVRHAQASFGAADYDVLSDRAEAQVAALAAALERRGVADARTVSGPLRRQRETAALGRDDRPMTIDDRLAEYDSDQILTVHAGSALSLEGRPDGTPITSQEFQAVLDPALEAWIAAGPDSEASQTWPDFQGGAVDAIRALAADLGRGETGLAFSSAGTIAAICAVLVGAPERAFVPFNRVQVNTGITKIAIGRSGLSLVSFNDHSHLDDADPSLVTFR